MAYDFYSYRGIPRSGLDLSGRAPIPASPATTDGFVEMVEAQRPEGVPDSEGFSTVLRHDDRPVVVELHPDDEDRLGLDRPLGLAVAHNVAKQRRFLWHKGKAPGIYTVTKTVLSTMAKTGPTSKPMSAKTPVRS